jgi:hypothetical protein
MRDFPALLRPSKTPSFEEGVKTLKNLGVTEKQSSVWQRLAKLSDKEFEAKVDDIEARALVTDGRNAS